MSLVAVRDIPIGDETLSEGEALTPELAGMLPVGRVEQLRSMRLLADRGDDGPTVSELQAQVAELAARVERLEAGGNENEAKPRRGRPRKEAPDGVS